MNKTVENWDVWQQVIIASFEEQHACGITQIPVKQMHITQIFESKSYMLT